MNDISQELLDTAVEEYFQESLSSDAPVWVVEWGWENLESMTDLALAQFLADRGNDLGTWYLENLQLAQNVN